MEVWKVGNQAINDSGIGIANLMQW